MSKLDGTSHSGSQFFFNWANLSNLARLGILNLKLKKKVWKSWSRFGTIRRFPQIRRFSTGPTNLLEPHLGGGLRVEVVLGLGEPLPLPRGAARLVQRRYHLHVVAREEPHAPVVLALVPVLVDLPHQVDGVVAAERQLPAVARFGTIHLTNIDGKTRTFHRRLFLAISAEAYRWKLKASQILPLEWYRTAIEWWILNEWKLLDGLISEILSQLNFLFLQYNICIYLAIIQPFKQRTICRI